jgi:hypothetical protein
MPSGMALPPWASVSPSIMAATSSKERRLVVLNNVKESSPDPSNPCARPGGSLGRIAKRLIANALWATRNGHGLLSPIPPDIELQWDG